MVCLWCDEEMMLQMDWGNLLFGSKQEKLCANCRMRFQFLEGNRCQRCSRMSEKTVCPDCKWWDAYYNGSDILTFNYSIFTYNGFMKEMLAKWKYRGDYALGLAFEPYVKRHFLKQFSFLKKAAIIVPIPLGRERILERGFNQAKVLADFLPWQQQELLVRVHGEKQAKKTRRQRLDALNPFELKTISINKPAVLVDDIYTTGTTIRHAASLLKERGCPEIYAFTLIKG